MEATPDLQSLQDEASLESHTTPALSEETDFQLFPSLPIELRLKIWKLASQVPRLVEVRFPKNSLSHKHDFVSDPPAVLHTSHEAREEALKSYTLDLATKHTLYPVCFNFEVDILYLRRHVRYWDDAQVRTFLKLLPGPEKIKRLALTAYVEHFDTLWGSLPPIILGFPKLQEVAVLQTVDRRSDGSCGEGVGSCQTISRRNRSTIIDDEEIAAVHDCSHLGKPHIWPTEYNVYSQTKNLVVKFLKDLRAQRWDNSAQWQEPVFISKGVCHKAIEPEQYHCPPVVQKAHATRGSKRQRTE